MNHDHFTLPTFAECESAAAQLHITDLAGIHRPEGVVEAAALALALYRADHIGLDALMDAAASEVATRQRTKTTFVPIFITNTCDADCKMCGMRASNEALERRVATREEIVEQLRILREAEGVSGVGFLTGEYDSPELRREWAELTAWAIDEAMAMGFTRIYFNIGSMSASEVGVMKAGLGAHPPAVMCVFQESYDAKVYARFMGAETPANPKSRFLRRLNSFDHWLDSGFTYVNPGFLVGLGEPDHDLAMLASHVQHLKRRGASVDMSLPRLRPASGRSNRSRVDDETYLRIIACLAFVFPAERIVLTTRETAEFQQRALPLIGVISPGSPDVAPYKWDTQATNHEHSSQFLIPDLRRPRDILRTARRQGYEIERFEDKG